jgi:DNA-binding protein HU-beta
MSIEKIPREKTTRRSVLRRGATGATLLGFGVATATPAAARSATKRPGNGGEERKPMGKPELVEAIASKSGLSKADAKRALDSFVSATSGALADGRVVDVEDFGRWQVVPVDNGGGDCDDRDDGARPGVRGDKRNTVKFKAGAELSGQVN